MLRPRRVSGREPGFQVTVALDIIVFPLFPFRRLLLVECSGRITPGRRDGGPIHG